MQGRRPPLAIDTRLSSTEFPIGVSGVSVMSPLAGVALPGRSKAIIAVIDSGFDLEHPNINYVDRALHFNAIEYLRQRESSPSVIGRRRYYDASRSIRAHGTSVAGAAAAVQRNSRQPAINGVAAGFPIMPLKVGARPTAAQVAVAIHWAVEHGARVINMSFKMLEQREVRDAIEHAWRSGLVLCAAAGNRRPGFPYLGVDFPARHPNVIAVGAVDHHGRRKKFNEQVEGDWGSQFGNELDLVAFGIAVRTLDDRGALGVFPGNYSFVGTGTSIASPQVAGLAALLFGIYPKLNNQQVRDAIEASCRKLAGYRYRRVQGRKWLWNREVGYGLIDIMAAISTCKSYRMKHEGGWQ